MKPRATTTQPCRRDGLARRDALLDAALACFAERGILATGIEQIRSRAGASPSSVYHLFGGGLPALVVALLVRTFARLFAHLAARVTVTSEARAAVCALVDGHLEWVLGHRKEARFMYQAMALELGGDRDGTLAAAKAQQLAPVVAHLQAFIAAGALPPWSPLVFDLVLLGPSHEACRRYLAGAAIEAAWMRAALPALAWQCVAPLSRRSAGRSARGRRPGGR
jgi:AcrR family transcriptional regulator